MRFRQSGTFRSTSRKLHRKSAPRATSGLVRAKAIQGQDDQGIAQTRAANQIIASLAPEEEARWKSRAQAVVDEWTKSTPDGARVLAAYRTEIAEIRKGK